ncbi:hypothetical protein ACQP2C_32600 [Micromonospora zamorensis]|uniref:hypothetical protein n=1 Tax=Micromonospora zamorensis TaxID=709883 RepID=UPI003D97E298
MTTPDLFTIPAPAPACRRCQAEVLRVRDTELGVSLDLEPTPIPVLGPFPADRALIENHPTHGWHAPSSPRRRGYPLHLIHTCKPKPESEHQP